MKPWGWTTGDGEPVSTEATPGDVGAPPLLELMDVAHSPDEADGAVQEDDDDFEEELLATYGHGGIDLIHGVHEGLEESGAG